MKTLIMFLLLSPALLAQTSTQPSGSGTANDPYLIATLENLYWITQNPGSWDKHFKQTADIDASETSTWFGGQGWEPIGGLTNSFDGEYDGQGHTINGLFINRGITDGVGLFGAAVSAVIKNLGLTNVNITGNNNVGGLVGEAESISVMSCYVTGSVDGNNNVGGLSGNNDNITVSGCYSDGTVSGAKYVGGLLGYVGPGSLVNGCYSGAAASGLEAVGGFAGQVDFSAGSYGIFNSYSRGDVTRLSGTSAEFGGFVGKAADSDIGDCFNTGDVVYDGAYNPTDKGFVGVTGGTCNFTNNYLDKEASNQISGTGATAKTTMDMQRKSTYGTWDFTNVWRNNPNVNDGYPFLYWEGESSFAVAPSGNGTTVPFSIDSLQNLYWISEDYHRWGYKFVQGSDIDATPTSGWCGGAGWNPVGDELIKFTGSYNGQNHSITGLFIYRDTSNNVGLFGFAANADISNLNLLFCEITGYNNTGGLLGNSYATNVENASCSDGNISQNIKTGKTPGYNSLLAQGNSITGHNNVGGLIGLNTSGSTITRGRFSGSVFGNNDVGGVAGASSGGSTLSGCGSSGSVSGNYYVGGLTGENSDNSDVINSYSTGTVSSTGHYVGGLVGYNYSYADISGSYSECQVGGSGDCYGGLAGLSYENSTIADSYSRGNVTRTGGTFVTYGAFAGWINSTTIQCCYSTGSVTYNATTDPDDKGFVGSASGTNTYTSNFFDYEVSNQTTGTGASAGTTAEMKTEATFTGWDFTSTWKISSAKNDAYPYHVWQDVMTAIEDEKNVLPVTFMLNQNYPNPFNPATQITYTIPEESIVTLTVYNILGQKVAQLINGQQPAGRYTVNFDGKNLGSGVYIYRLNAGNFSSSKKMILLR